MTVFLYTFYAPLSFLLPIDCLINVICVFLLFRECHILYIYLCKPCTFCITKCLTLKKIENTQKNNNSNNNNKSKSNNKNDSNNNSKNSQKNDKSSHSKFETQTQKESNHKIENSNNKMKEIKLNIKNNDKTTLKMAVEYIQNETQTEQQAGVKQSNFIEITDTINHQ